MRMILVLIRRYHSRMPSPTAKSDDLTERLERADLKPSANRLAVLEALATEPNDATAQEIHRRLASSGSRIGLATVYRALASMSEAGVVDRLPHDAAESCYR